MSPYVLLQLVGPAVAFHTGETLHQAFPDRFGVSENQRRMVEAGKTTLLAWDGATPRIADDVAELFEVGDSPSTAEQVRQRALDAVAQEIRLMLDEGVVAEPQDIDLCMLLGAGWPFHLGGITPVPRPHRHQRARHRPPLPPPGRRQPAPLSGALRHPSPARSLFDVRRSLDCCVPPGHPPGGGGGPADAVPSTHDHRP